MNTSRLLVAVVLVAAIGAPIAGFWERRRGNLAERVSHSFMGSRLAPRPVRPNSHHSRAPTR